MVPHIKNRSSRSKLQSQLLNEAKKKDFPRKNTLAYFGGVRVAKKREKNVL
jgi:hypothetical protein